MLDTFKHTLNRQTRASPKWVKGVPAWKRFKAF